MEDQKLLDYFKFDEADLEANRKGEYSETQKKRLFKGLFAPRKYFLRKWRGPSGSSLINWIGVQKQLFITAYT